MPQPHPSACQPGQDIDDADYQDLVNSVERHTRCSAAYCLRQKGAQQTPTCRFKFPREVQEQTNIQFEELSDGRVRATLHTKRNDPRVNPHQRTMLQGWRANVDLQIIVDVESCARYIAKYAAKGEPKSTSAASIFANCVAKLNDTDNPQTALRSSMLRAVGERDFCAQETAHMLSSLPLYSCTYSFVCISLEGSCTVRTHTSDRNAEQSAQQPATDPSILEWYANRLQYEINFSGITTLNLCTFAATYTIYRGELRARSKEVIVRTFPTFSPNPSSPTYGNYCKYQLIKYKPWSTAANTLWCDNEEVDETYIKTYHEFLLSQEVHKYLPSIAEELNRAHNIYSILELTPLTLS